jgi:putative membrane protein
MRRPVLVAAGLLALGLVWLAPVARVIPGPFSTHMTIHMTVVALAAPLLAIGLAGGRLDPVRVAPRLFAPIPASIAELAAVWIWHAPALHHLARHSTAAFAAEQTTFLAAGLFVWLSCVGPDARGHRTGLGVVALLLTSMHMTLLGALLALAGRPLYAGAHPASIGALTPLQDQHLAGAIMLLAGGASYLAGGLGLAAGLLRRHAARPAARRLEAAR